MFKTPIKKLNDINVKPLQCLHDKPSRMMWATMCAADVGGELVAEVSERSKQKQRKKQKRATTDWCMPGYRWCEQNEVWFKDWKKKLLVVATSSRGGEMKTVMKMAIANEGATDAVEACEHTTPSAKEMQNELLMYDIATGKAKDIRNVKIRYITTAKDHLSFAVFVSEDQVASPLLLPSSTLNEGERRFLSDARRGFAIYKDLLLWWKGFDTQGTTLSITQKVEAYLKSGSDKLENTYGRGANHLLRCVVPTGHFDDVPFVVEQDQIFLAKQCSAVLTPDEITSRAFLFDSEKYVRLTQTGRLSLHRHKVGNESYRRVQTAQRKVPADDDENRTSFGRVGGDLATTLAKPLIDVDAGVKHTPWSAVCRSHAHGAAETQLLDAATAMVLGRLCGHTASADYQCSALLNYARFLLHGVKIDRSFGYAVSPGRNHSHRTKALDAMTAQQGKKKRPKSPSCEQNTPKSTKRPKPLLNKTIISLEDFQTPQAHPFAMLATDDDGDVDEEDIANEIASWSADFV
jgi:hypothetical protein